MSLRNTLIQFAGRIPFIRDIANRYFIIGRFANAAPARPRPFSMTHPYTSWHGLTDRTWSGRHLPEASQDYIDSLPPEEKVVDLFKRDSFKPAHDTSVMFMFFAQWFTDSFLRTDFFDPRRNSSNHEIDLCQIYGLTEDKAKMLRARDGTGRLASQVIDGEEFPEFLFEKVDGKLVLRDRFKGKDGKPDLHPGPVLDHVLGAVPDDRKRNVFGVGLEHGNATIGYAVLNTLFLREHNRIAGEIAKEHPDWDDERLFQTARMVLTFILLKIVIEDYIRHISPIDFPIKAVVGAADKAKWGKTNWIAIEFNLLYRWHSLVPDTMQVNGEALDSKGFLNNNGLVLDRGISPFFTEFSAQKAGKIGLKNNPLFMFMAEPGKRSTVGRTIHISRVAKLQPFNAYRKQFGLKPVRNFEELTGETELAAELRDLYGDIDRVEWFVGLFAEAYGEASLMGELQATMVAHDAFTQALTNPLLSKNIYSEATLSKTGKRIADATNTLRQLVERNAKPGTICTFAV